MKYFVKIVLVVMLFSFALPNVVAAATTSKKKTTQSSKKKTTKKSTKKTSSKKTPVKTVVKKPVSTPSSNSTANKAAPASLTNPNSEKVLAPSGRVISANLVTKDPEIKTRSVEITQTETFVRILGKLGFTQKNISILTQRLAREAGFIATAAKPGQKIQLTEKTEGDKRKLLSMQIPTDNYMVKIFKNKAGMMEIKKELRPEAPAYGKSQFFFRSGVIQTNITALGDRLSVPTSVTAKASRVINSKINSSQIKRGDKLDMLYENTFNNAGSQTGVRLVYFKLLYSNKTLEGFRYSPDGKDTGEFYDPSGESFTKSLLSSPLKGKHKITSGFGYRNHPIFGRRLLHSGVDFGARSGEPIYAAGDGTIDKFGRYGGYGNFLRIKHDSTWSTAYAHLKAYQKGLYLWKRVKKGELIGYVGSTGSSTGPHLHFELQQNGKAINPLKAKLPAGGKKLIGKDLFKFKQEAGRIRTIIGQNRNK